MGVPASVDRRVERTKDQLRIALLDLAETVDLGALTVHDITRRAGVNRATFYQHYRDKDDLLEQTIDSLLHELFDGCAPVLAGIDRLVPDAIHPSVTQMFEQVAKRSTLYGRLIGPGGSAYFIRRFQSRNEELSLQVMHHMETSQLDGGIPAEARAHVGASATAGLISYWLESGQKESAETIAAWCWRLLRPVWFDLDE